MKRPPLILLILILPFLLMGCTGSLYVLEPEGDVGSIKLSGQQISLQAELLAIDREEGVLYVEMREGEAEPKAGYYNKMAGIKLDEIESVTIQNYVNNKWVAPWIGFQVIPTVLIAVAAGQVDGSMVGGAALSFGIPTIINGLILYFSSPDPPKLKPAFTSSKLDELNKYTRYPLGLNKKQLQELASARGQTGLRIIGEDDPGPVF